MVEFPDEKELNELKAFDKPFCVSIYLPFKDEPNAENNPNRIELKNMLRQAETALKTAGLKQSAIANTMRSAWSLLDGREFWSARTDNLALFTHPKFFRYYHFPGNDIPQLLTVEKGFNLEPLLNLLQNNNRYFVLSLSHNNVNLYEGNHYELKQVKLKDLPNNMEEAIGIDEYPSWLETHRVAPTRYGKKSESFHGQYNVSQTDKTLLLEFFRRIDRRLKQFLSLSRAPLIIAGVEYLLPIYRQANTYPALVARGITGNQEHSDLDSLREKAWNLVKR